MMTWKQKCEEERLYYTRLWRWNPDKGDYNVIGLDNLTFDEAKRYFDKTRMDSLHDQVDIFREYSEDYSEKIALKYEGFETWDRDEM